MEVSCDVVKMTASRHLRPAVILPATFEAPSTDYAPLERRHKLCGGGTMTLDRAQQRLCALHGARHNGDNHLQPRTQLLSFEIQPSQWMDMLLPCCSPCHQMPFFQMQSTPHLDVHIHDVSLLSLGTLVRHSPQGEPRSHWVTTLDSVATVQLLHTVRPSTTATGGSAEGGSDKGQGRRCTSDALQVAYRFVRLVSVTVGTVIDIGVGTGINMLIKGCLPWGPARLPGRR